MVIEIIAGVGVLGFIILVIFTLLIFRDIRRSLKKMDRTLNDAHAVLEDISEPTKHLVQSLNKLTLDFKKKSEGLDVLFRPLYRMREGDHEEDESLSNIIESIGGAIRLFKKIKKEITR